MKKTILPFYLFENLQNIEDLSPEEKRDFLISLKKFCEIRGKDFLKICNDLEVELPEWSKILSPNQVKFLDDCMYKSTYPNRKGSTWVINPETGLVDVEGDFILGNSGLPNLNGVKFGVVNGTFNLANSKLNDLSGFPKEVNGNVNLRSNELESLEGLPEKLGGGLILSWSKNLENLIGAPKEIKGDLNIENCYTLKSLEGSPKKVRVLLIESCPNLQNLKGGPEFLEGQFERVTITNCSGINSLIGFPQKAESSIEVILFNLPNLFTLEGIPADPDFKISRLDIDKLGLKRQILRRAYNAATKYKSWLIGHISMFTDPDFIATGKAPKDPIRERLTPDRIKKEMEENRGAFILGIKDYLEDFRVKKLLRGIEIPKETKEKINLALDLGDIGIE